jgi:hypothetical protein
MSRVDDSAAYERLERILAQQEYQGFTSPFEWLVTIYEWSTGWYASQPLWVQLVLLSVLLLVLAAILAHIVWVMVRMWRAGAPRERPDEGETAGTVGDLPAARVLLDDAARALGAGLASEALRLYYLAVLARLREAERIPRSTALTGREILERTRPPLPPLSDATSLFEDTVYGGREPGTEDVAAVRRLAEEV